MFVIEYAKEIMFLCFGVGFLGVSIYLMRTLMQILSISRKINDLTDLFIEYIQKPLSIIMQVYGVFSKAKKWFKK